MFVTKKKLQGIYDAIFDLETKIIRQNTIISELTFRINSTPKFKLGDCVSIIVGSTAPVSYTEPYKIISKDVFTNAPSWHEWQYEGINKNFHKVRVVERQLILNQEEKEDEK